MSYDDFEKIANDIEETFLGEDKVWIIYPIQNIIN